MIGDLKLKVAVALVVAAALAAAGVYHFAKVAGLESTIETQGETITTQATKIGELEGKVTTLQSSLQTALDANEGLEAAVNHQNEAIDRMKKEAAERAARAAAALAKARAELQETKKKYDELLDKPPADPDNMCHSLDIRLQQYIETRHTEVAK